jgi:DnaJ-domain-containing protein 1
MFTFDQCAMVGAKGDGFGVCERCFHFMWHAANEKVRAVRDGVANAAKNAARQRQAPAEPARPKPWDVLGVAADASEEEIKKAYRKLAAMTHPDRVPPGASDEEREAARARFEEITRCYDVMMKVRKKASA